MASESVGSQGSTTIGVITSQRIRSKTVLLSLFCRKHCEAQIKGFPNARHKKFVSLRDAQEFVTGADASNTPHSEEESPKSASGSKTGGQKRFFAEIEDESGWDVVYSDGACKGNGKVGSVAGLGIWWGEDDARYVMGYSSTN